MEGVTVGCVLPPTSTIGLSWQPCLPTSLTATCVPRGTGSPAFCSHRRAPRAPERETRKGWESDRLEAGGAWRACWPRRSREVVAVGRRYPVAGGYGRYLACGRCCLDAGGCLEANVLAEEGGAPLLRDEAARPDPRSRKTTATCGVRHRLCGSEVRREWITQQKC